MPPLSWVPCCDLCKQAHAASMPSPKQKEAEGGRQPLVQWRALQPPTHRIHALAHGHAQLGQQLIHPIHNLQRRRQESWTRGKAGDLAGAVRQLGTPPPAGTPPPGQPVMSTTSSLHLDTVGRCRQPAGAPRCCSHSTERSRAAADQASLQPCPAPPHPAQRSAAQRNPAQRSATQRSAAQPSASPWR